MENQYIEEYANKCTDRSLNVKSNPVKQKEETTFPVSMESETALRERLQKLGITLKIKDNLIDKFLYFDGNVDGKRYRNVAKYKKQQKEEALAKLTKSNNR